MQKIATAWFLGIAVMSCADALAASNLDKATLSELNQLEQRYYSRTYATDADNVRIERLEKLVFGQTASGSIKERIDKMYTDLPPDTVPPSPSSSTSSGGDSDTLNQLDSYLDQTVSQPGAASTPDSSGSTDDSCAPDSNVDTQESYPRVSTLEQTILGHSFPAEPLAARLSRMELKAFGSVNTKLDLGGRTDALETYAQQTLHKPTLDQIKAAADADSDDSSATSDAPDDNTESYPRITSLEQIILNQTYPTDKLAARLSRMELKAFGHEDGKLDLSSRTDALEKYAQRTLHKTPLGAQINRETNSSGTSTDSNQPQAQSQRTKQILGLVGSSLLGIAGSALGVPMMPGLLPGMMPGIMETPNSKKTAPPHAAEADDPAVSSPNPPAPGSRMQVQVGWCEMQLFGHTFRQMHLSDRLRQISDAIGFNDTKSNMALMDDMDQMIKAIQARKPAPKTAGTDSAVTR